jgi:DeoR/GlpR family transcriptional regulator of sugar metabolism
MLNREREQEILSILKRKNGFVTVRQLCESLFASESSIRRDLKALESQGLVKRSYGGAALERSYSNIVTFNHRTRQNVSAKRAIGQKAAGLIKEGDILFLDQSSTAFYLAVELVDRSGLTVVTNNIEIMMLLANSKNRILSSGGFLSSENRNCLIGSDAQRTFESVYADAAFFSVKALSGEGVVADCSREEVAVRDAMLKNAARKVLLCDSSKFGLRAPFRQCGLEDVDILISEEDRAQRFAAYGDRVRLL